LRDGGVAAAEVAGELHGACRDVGFFSIVGHGVDPALQDRLRLLAGQFFSLPVSEKTEIAMGRAGRAWRGWFPLGGELTAGVPDQKEGIYFGHELTSDHPLVQTGTPMHGPNLFPSEPGDLRTVVLDYMDAITKVGQLVLSGIALGLGLPQTWFAEHLTANPLVLFRIFRYPPLTSAVSDQWNVGEHTDYGLLTILGQDDQGGLQVRTSQGWVDVPPRSGHLVCNLGDMLERLTGGLYRSTPHRVLHRGNEDRYSFPFFLDPGWEAVVSRLPVVERPLDDDAASRWDHVSVHGFEGTYGEYILSKVGHVFPDLAKDSLP
jgi:isopenicillin N synthase-like dioxygenase